MRIFYFAMIKTFILSVLLLISTSSFAVTDNYLCSRYKKLNLHNEETILAVGIRRIYTASVEIYVLGFGKTITASFNGENISSDMIFKRRTIKCDDKIIGQTRIYDLSNFKADTSGLFKIQSADKEASTYVEVN